MKPQNPLLNRLYQSKSSKKQQRPMSLKDQISNRDRVLVPKLHTKKAIQALPDISERQKTTIIKPNKTKLPALTPKQFPSSYIKKTSFRERKISFKQHGQVLYFPTQLDFQSHKEEEQKPIFTKQPSIKSIVPKKQFQTQLPSSSRTEQQLFEYLKVIEQNQELNEQFCYMNRGQLPYSYYIVEYEDVNKNQFLTVSLRGVTIYKYGENQFTTVEKLAREIQLYRKVKKIQFFKDYVKDKVMRHWKYRAIRRKFQHQCKTVEKKFFIHNMILQDYLHFLHAHAQDFSKSKFLSLRISVSQDFQGLKMNLQKIQEKIDKSMDFFEKQIYKNIMQTIEKNKKRFRQQERVTLGQGQDEKQQGFLPFDSKKRPMKYTQMAKIKQFQQSMFRLIKLTDLVRFNTKVQMIADGLQDFTQEMQNLHKKYQKRKQMSFVSWIKITADLDISNPKKCNLICSPSIAQIKNLITGHKKNILDKIFRKHVLLVEQKDQFDCQTIQMPQQLPNRFDIKYFIEKNDDLRLLSEEADYAANVCFTDIQEILEKCINKLLVIYDESGVSKSINQYMENQNLKVYLQSYSANKSVLSSWESQIQFGLAILDMKELISKIEEKFENKYKQIANAIPAQVMRRCENLAKNITQIYNTFKQNPENVHEYINFIKSYQLQKKNIPKLQKKIEQVLDLEEMVFKNGLRIGQNAKIHINQCNTYFRELSNRLQEIESNEEKDRKKIQKTVDDIVEPLDLKSEELYKKIYEDSDISNSDFDPQKAIEKLKSYEQEFEKVKAKKDELFYFQDQLGMGHKDLPNYFKCEVSLDWLVKLWNGKKRFQAYEEFIKTKGYVFTLKLDLTDLLQFNNDIQAATADIQQVELLQNFKQEALKIFKVIEISKMVATETLQDQHFNSIKQKLVTKNKRIKDYLFTREGGKTIICQSLVQETNLAQIKEQLQQIVFSSAQENIIKKNLSEMDEFWKKNKLIIITSDIARNGSQIHHLGINQNDQLLEKLGSFLVTFKNILGSKHSSVGDLKERVMAQIQACQYIKKLLQKWVQVEKQWIKLLPLMTNCPSVKHQSNVFFEFTSVDTSLKKMNRQMFDVILKRIVDDKKDQKYLNLLMNCERDLKEVNKIFNSFLEMKRNTYHRFFFLADQELITILEKTKDGKTLAEYAGMCFNCDRIILDKELISGFETSSEVFKLRKTIIRGQPDQMFKSVQQNMKNSLKFSIIALLPKMKIGMNIQQEHKEYSLQSILMADKLLWTQMTQLYLNQNSYSSYQAVIRRPCAQLSKYIGKYDLSTQYRYKLSIRLVQMMSLHQIGLDMIKDQTSKEDFKWKQQLKFTIEEEDIYITQFNRKFQYGLEYYPPQKISIPTDNYRMLLYQAHSTAVVGDKVLLVKGLQGQGKRNLMKACASQYGCYYKELICNKNISIQYIMRFVQGAISTGAWLSFYQFEHLDDGVLIKLLNQLKKLISVIQTHQQETLLTISRKKYKEPEAMNTQGEVEEISPNNIVPGILNIPARTTLKTTNRVLFNFITHGMNPQKVSVYSFDTQVLVQPNHKKVCEWLLQANNFQNWEHLSMRLITFLQTVFPFLERVMGSFIGILRKLIDVACVKKSQIFHVSTHKMTIKDDFAIFSQTFKTEVIDKSDQNIHHILYQALKAYFHSNLDSYYDEMLPKKTAKKTSPERIRKQSITINSKVQVLRSLMSNSKVKNILVIGPRTNKTTLIEEACDLSNRPHMTIYPQACEYFFTDDVIEYLNKIDEDVVLRYDGESILREWSDLVISGYLLVEGKKIYLKNKTVIMEMREVVNCSPSFVGSCQIVYVGNTLTKKQKFLVRSMAENCDLIMQPVYQIFGEELQHLPDHLLQIMAELLKPYAKNPQSKNYHKLIVWLATILGIDGIWNRYYGGKHTDVTVSKYSQELTTIDESKYMPVEEQTIGSLNGSLLIHTKTTILYYEFFRNVMQLSLPIIMCGNYDCGKSTIIQLLLNYHGFLPKKNLNKSRSGNLVPNSNQSLQPSRSDALLHTQSSKISLPIMKSTQQWTGVLKSGLTNIRRQGKNMLLNIGDKDIILTIDDLDLGKEYHREYVRQIIDMESVRDSKFQQYKLQYVKILAAWHLPSSHQNQARVTQINKNKLLDRMLQVQLPLFTKDSLQTIIRTNLDSFTRKHNMNKQVMGIIDRYVVKSILMVFEDITNISGQNTAAGIALAILRNLLSLPKKNYFISGDNYLTFFKSQLKVRTMERCFTSKITWQYTSVLQNIFKVMFGEIMTQLQLRGSQGEKTEGTNKQLQQNYQQKEQIIYLDRQFKQHTIGKIKSSIQKAFPLIHIFPQMLAIVIKLNNQLNCIDGNCVLLGRNGTGKKTILQIAASLNRVIVMDGYENISAAMFECYKGRSVILMQAYLRKNYTNFITANKSTLYSQITCIEEDEELQEKYITDADVKKHYREIKTNSTSIMSDDEGGTSSGSNRLVKKVRSKMKNVIILDNLIKYKQVISQYREINRYFVCYIDQWPIQALLTISGTHLKNSSFTSYQGISGEEVDKIYEVNKVLAEVYTNTNRITQSHEDSSISIKKFQEFVEIYNKMYQYRYKLLSKKIQFYTKIYSKFHEACMIIKEWEKRVDVLRVNLSEMIAKLDEELSKNREEEINFSTLHQKMATEDSIMIEKNAEMAQVKRQTEGQLSSMKKVMDNIEKIVSSMQRSEMSEMKKIYKNSKLVGFGLECLCLLFKQEISEKSINKILADPNLMMKMKSHNVLDERNYRVEQKWATQHEEIQKQLKSKSHTETSKIIIEWIKVVIEYWKISEQYKSLHTKYKTHKAAYQKSVKQQNKLEAEIQQLKQKMLKVNKDFAELFKQKQNALKEYNSLNGKIRNAKQLVPALTKSEGQTWQMVKEVRDGMNCLAGDLILAVTCIVYLPLRKLKLKKEVIEGIKKLLISRVIQFHDTFMASITRVQDAGMEDLNFTAIKELDDYPMLILDPERRAGNFIFELDTHIFSQIEVLTVEKQNQLPNNNSRKFTSSALQEQKDEEEGHKQKQNKQQQQQKEEGIQKNLNKLEDYEDPQTDKKDRKQKIYQITEESHLRSVLQKLPQQTIAIDWKFTSLNTNQKVFLKLAEHKKPQYFQAKKQLNRRVKKDLQKIQEYKRVIYEKICEKQIKILDDTDFVETGIKLVQLEEETQNNKRKEQEKIKQIANLSKQINQEVHKIIYMVNALKKIRNVALDIILDIACSPGNSVENVIKWALCILPPNQRMGWLLVVATDFAKDVNDELFSILARDTPLKVAEGARGKKPIAISNKNYENICRLLQYSPSLRSFCETVIKNPKQFEMWTLDGSFLTIPHLFRPQNLSMTEQLVIVKIFKPRILFPTINRLITKNIGIQISSYSNKQLLERVNHKFPVIAKCSMKHVEELCEQLNEGRMEIKNLVEIDDEFEMRKILWKQMERGSWLVVHSIVDNVSRQKLQNLVEYVMNYDKQDNFRVFIFVDQREDGQKTREQILISGSKYIENIAVHIFEEQKSTHKIMNLNPFITGIFRKKSTKINQQQSLPNNSNVSTHLAIERQKIMSTKIWNFCSIADVAATIKYPHLKLHNNINKVISVLKYITQYNIPLEFNVNAIGEYVGYLYSAQLDQRSRLDIKDMIGRIIDETKIFQKQIYGIPTDPIPEIDKKMASNYQILGMEESYLQLKNKKEAENALDILGKVKYYNRSAREQVSDIRAALSRIPTNVLVFSRQFKNQLYLHAYMNQLKKHNASIIGVKEFIEWMNISSNKEYKQEDQEQPNLIVQQCNNSNSESLVDSFTWPNLLSKISRLIGYKVTKNKIRTSLTNWLNNLKKRHQFLLYWNLDSNVMVLNPVLMFNFRMAVSSYIIRYLNVNYEKIKVESDSIGQNVLYTLQIQFSRQTDQKDLYMNEGILLPELILHEFRYNFELKMLDAQLDSSGQQLASLIMLKMKKIAKISDEKQIDYESPPIVIATRFMGHVVPVYQIDTYIDGNFPEWEMRKPMLISQS